MPKPNYFDFMRPEDVANPDPIDSEEEEVESVGSPASDSSGIYPHILIKNS